MGMLETKMFILVYMWKKLMEYWLNTRAKSPEGHSRYVYVNATLDRDHDLPHNGLTPSKP